MTNNKSTEAFYGVIAANIFAFAILGFTILFTEREATRTIFFGAEFVVIPLLMGIISAWYWRALELKGITYTGYSVLNGIIAIILSAVFLREGVICLVIVAPLIFGFIIAGAFIGKAMFRRKNNTLNVSVISLLLVIFLVDALKRKSYENLVTDTIVINATPAEVWKHVVAFEKITEPNKYWLFQMGMPSPMETIVNGYHQGANRKCIFSNGYIFDETMVVYQPDTNLTFDIIGQPRDPEIMGHIDILRGQFLLRNNGDGTTTLTGNSWYRLYVSPAWYYDTWARSITRNVHLRVMTHIKQLSEKKI